ncbi:MAG TPA: acyltransferase [Tepidisphaeraceae bacterium]|nr:acyltransferase [Tepidisphaeraceae bacterium]
MSLGVFIALRRPSHTKTPALSDILLHATLLFNYVRTINCFGINPVYWSLAIEWQFYLLLPVVVLLCRRAFPRSGRRTAVMVLASLFCAGIAGRAIEFHLTTGRSDTRFTSAFSYLDLFAAGMMVSFLDRFDVLPRSDRMRLLSAIGGVLIFLACNNWAHFSAGGEWLRADDAFYIVAFPAVLCLGIALVLLGVVADPGRGFSILRAKPFVRVGIISYSLYLYHTGVQFVVLRFAGIRSSSYMFTAFGNAAISLAPTLLVSTAMFYLVENPSLRWASRLRSPGGRPSAAAALNEPSMP